MGTNKFEMLGRSNLRNNQTIQPPAAAPTLLVIHWGTSGGGPWFAVRMAGALASTWSGSVFTSFNRNAEIMSFGEPVENTLPVSTYRSIRGLILGLPRMVILGWKLRKFIRHNDVGIVYSAMLSIWQSLCTFAFIPRNVQFVASIHDALEHPGDEHWVLRLCRRLDIRRANALAVYSDAVRDALRTQLYRKSKPILLVPLGSDAPNEVARNLEERGNLPVRLGFLGRIVEYKGLDLFVELIATLRLEGMNVVGVVTGAGTVDPHLIVSSKDTIFWNIGWIPEASLTAAVQGIDILILPYREASQSGVHSLCLSAGIPSVATPVGGLVAQVLSTCSGEIAEAVSARALADAVKIVMAPETYSRLSRQCLSAAASSASWEHAAVVLGEALSSLDATPKPPLQ